MSSPKRESVTVLEECIDLQKRKSQDYQNPNSNIVQSMHYRRGVSTIHDMISQKLLRAQSLLEAYEYGEGSTPNFESLEDTYKDLINYASFAVSYLRGKMEGQNPDRDMLNRSIPKKQLDFDAKIEPYSLDEIREMTDDTSGGSSSGQVEADGFITVVPTSFSGFSDEPQKIPLNEDQLKDMPTESRLKGKYFKEVLPKGEVRVPRGVTNCTDSVQHAYVNNVRGRKKPLPDISTRMDEDIKEHIERLEDKK